MENWKILELLCDESFQPLENYVACSVLRIYRKFSKLFMLIFYPESLLMLAHQDNCSDVNS